MKSKISSEMEIKDEQDTLATEPASSVTQTGTAGKTSLLSTKKLSHMKFLLGKLRQKG